MRLGEIMENKKFEKLMKEYIASTGNSSQKDLYKYRSKEAHPSKNIPTWCWACLSCFLIISIALSIFFPIYLKDNATPPNNDNTTEVPTEDPTDPVTPPPPPPVQYFDGDSYKFTMVESIEFVNDEYNINILRPTIICWKDDETGETVDTVNVIQNKDDDMFLGILDQLVVYDAYFDEINYFAILNQYSLQTLDKFNLCTDSLVWNHYNILYSINIEDGVNVYLIKFSDENLDYYIEVTNYYYLDVMGIDMILDLIF